MVNVTIYGIHGSYGKMELPRNHPIHIRMFHQKPSSDFCWSWWLPPWLWRKPHMWAPIKTYQNLRENIFRAPRKHILRPPLKQMKTSVNTHQNLHEELLFPCFSSDSPELCHIASPHLRRFRASERILADEAASRFSLLWGCLDIGGTGVYPPGK